MKNEKEKRDYLNALNGLLDIHRHYGFNEKELLFYIARRLTSEVENKKCRNQDWKKH